MTTDMTARELYEADVARRPHYHDGTMRHTWDQLGELEQWSWNRPIESFQIATTYIADGDYAGALPFLERAAKVMAGDPDFDYIRANAAYKAERVHPYAADLDWADLSDTEIIRAGTTARRGKAKT